MTTQTAEEQAPSKENFAELLNEFVGDDAGFEGRLIKGTRLQNQLWMHFPGRPDDLAKLSIVFDDIGCGIGGVGSPSSRGLGSSNEPGSSVNYPMFGTRLACGAKCLPGSQAQACSRCQSKGSKILRRSVVML